MSDKFIWYKQKIAGPYQEFPTDWDVYYWKELVDSGRMAEVPDHPPMNEDMENHPEDAHIICNQEELKK